MKKWERKAKFFSNTRAISSLRKPQKIKEKLFKKISISPLSWPDFFEGPFLALGEGIGFWMLGVGHPPPIPPPSPMCYCLVSCKPSSSVSVSFGVMGYKVHPMCAAGRASFSLSIHPRPPFIKNTSTKEEKAAREIGPVPRQEWDLVIKRGLSSPGPSSTFLAFCSVCFNPESLY